MDEDSSVLSQNAIYRKRIIDADNAALAKLGLQSEYAMRVAAARHLGLSERAQRGLAADWLSTKLAEIAKEMSSASRRIPT